MRMKLVFLLASMLVGAIAVNAQTAIFRDVR